jgi:hypothetical protein
LSVGSCWNRALEPPEDRSHGGHGAHDPEEQTQEGDAVGPNAAAGLAEPFDIAVSPVVLVSELLRDRFNVGEAQALGRYTNGDAFERAGARIVRQHLDSEYRAVEVHRRPDLADR